LVRAPREFAEAAADWVCVRITDMRDVDVGLIRFDFDLTMAVVLMHPDGTVYHRYGSRDADDAVSWMSIPSLVRLLRDSLDDHRDYCRSPEPPVRERQRAIDLPRLQRRIRDGQQIDCVHCHTVNDMEYEQAHLDRRWRDDDKWVYPEPRRVGLDLDPAQQDLVRAVTAGSPAAAAGLQPGDRLLRLGAQRRVRTIADVQWALHQLPATATKVALRRERDGEERDAEMLLPAGWKQCPPEEYAWRPYQWNLSPDPGFGGPALGAGQKQELGLPADAFAFRIQYLIDWGDKAHRGRAAAKAGIRRNDVVLSIAGKSDFRSVQHLQAWVRLTKQVGEEVDVVLLRDGERRTVRYALPE
jgi:hypothetical protein